MTYLLAIHLLGAIPTVLYSLHLIFSPTNRLSILTWLSFYTVTTGAVMAITVGQSFGDFCVKFGIYSLLIMAAYLKVYLKNTSVISVKKIISTLSILFLIGGLSSNTVFADDIFIILENTTNTENTPGWMFNRDIATSTPYEFNTQVASMGIGSLYVLPIGSNPSDKFIAEDFINTPISAVNSISYDFQMGSGMGQEMKNHFYMNVYANFGISDDFKYYDCRYNIVPSTGSNSSFTTVTFDPTLSYPVTQNINSPFACPSVPAEMDNLSLGSSIRVYTLNVGDTSNSDITLDGYLDRVIVNLDGGINTYDFEPKIGPTSRDQCIRHGWMIFNTPFFYSQGDCVRYFNHVK